jgi:hypothetical protein
MATSGTTAYDRTGAQIAEHAARLIRVIGVDETLDTTSGGEEDQILESLNLMIKTHQTKLGLWRYKEARLFLIDGDGQYALPGAKFADESEIGQTTLDADEASGQTVLSVAATTDSTKHTDVVMANSDVIGVVQDDDTIHWSTISSFSAGDTVTLNDATTAAASSGNKVYWYTTAGPRPLKIISARRDNAGNETEMFQLSREEYFNLPNKTATGSPTQYYYDPQQTTGLFYIWPEADTVSDVIRLTYMDELEIISANTDTSNFPQEWMEYLVYGLAVRIAPLYGVPVSNEVLAIYTESMSLLEGWDQDDASIQFSYGNYGRG